MTSSLVVNISDYNAHGFEKNLNVVEGTYQIRRIVERGPSDVPSSHAVRRFVANP